MLLLLRLTPHACFAAGDDRVAEEQVTGLELGVERLELERGTGSGEGVWRSAQLAIGLGVFRQDAGAGMAATAIELEPEHGVRIHAEADRARGVAGLEAGDKTLAPFTVVTHAAIEVVAVEIGVAQMQVERGACNKTFSGFVGVGNGWHRCGECNEQRGETESGRHRLELLWSDGGAIFIVEKRSDCRESRYLRGANFGHKKSR